MDSISWAGGGCLRALPPWWSCSVMPSWNGFPVIPDTYAKVLSNSEMHRKCFKDKINKVILFWTFAVLDLILWINTRSFRFEKHAKTMSVVFPIASLQSVLACIAEVRYRHPPFSFMVNFFRFWYGFSGHSKQQVSSRKKLLNFAFTNTQTTSSSFSEFTAQTVTPSMFYVSFSTVLPVEWWGSASGLFPTSEPLCSLIHKQNPNNHICLQLLFP